MSDGRVEFEITADGRKAYASIDEITAKLQKSGVKWEQEAKASTDQIGNSFEGMLKKVTAAFSAAAIGKALLDIGKQAIQAASDLQEVQNVVDVTFGEQGSATIEAWAKKAGTQFGLTETQAKKFTSTLGAMMKSAGLAGNEIVGMSTDMAGLAADMASFYNLDFDTAFQKIRAGISGETEPLKQLGINMSVANLNAFALQKGLSKTFDQMSQGEQVMLRYQYLMQATSDAQGDFARTSDGFANATRMLETNLESLKTQLGNVLLPIVNDVVGGLNSLLSQLTTPLDRTVLDEFKDIDANTAKKLADIEKTAEEARRLTEILDDIKKTSGTIKSDLEGSKVEIPDQTEKNARSLAQSLKDMAGANLSGVTTAMEDAKTLTEVVDGKGRKVTDNGLEKSIKDIAENSDSALLSTVALKEVVGTKSEQAGLGNEIAQMGTGAEKAKKNLEDIATGAIASSLEGVTESVKKSADATETVSDASDAWLETCKRLVQTIPGLNSIIDTQTGEVKGGTDAVYEYIDAWEQLQTHKILLNANQQKRNALDTKFAELPGYEVDMRVAEKRVRDQYAKIEALYKKYGLSMEGRSDLRTSMLGDNLSFENNKEINDAVSEYYRLEEASKAATKTYNEQKEAYDEASEALEEAEQVLYDEMTVKEKAVIVTDELSAAQAQLQTTFDAAKAAVDDYRKNALDKTTESVNKLIHGFNKIELPSLEDQVKPDEMIAGLRSQLQFMTEYQHNLEEARKAGLDENLLAELSDGSKESAEYLKTIAENPGSIKEINDLYREVNKEKEKFAEGLTDSTLAADEEYKNLQSAAEEAEKNLKTVSDQIAKALGSDLASQIENNLPAVQTAIDKLNSILSSINVPVVNIPFFNTGTGETEEPHPHETGLNFVPYTGYLASLHEGEGILTAEENRIWQAFKNGQRDIDYDQLGGFMRDNIKPGGDVYLDGRVVGIVISQMQGAQYRSLQRSGWQS